MTTSPSAANRRYVVATIRPWNLAVFEEKISRLPGEWRLITSPEELTAPMLATFDPAYVFFPHWSWKIPAEIYRTWPCVVFHETDLPYGRGGSPIQNLIAGGHDSTMVSAIAVTEGLDEGPVYLKRPLSLLGSGEEIFLRAANIIGGMIATIAAERPQPVPQLGEPVAFRRRQPKDSEIDASSGDLDRLFDHIRMLDADGYPPAFLRYGRYVLTFKRASRRTGSLLCDVEITLSKESE